MTTPKKNRNGIKLPKITSGSPLGLQDSSPGASRNSGGLQSSLISYARSRPAPYRRLKDNMSTEMSPNHNNVDYVSRISLLSSHLDAEAMP